MRLYVGTSGYSYPHWAEGVFYPKGLSSRQWLEFYSRHFNCVELNVTFYRLPTKAMAKSWQERTPKDFVFAVKGSRFVTHIKRLKDTQESLKIFVERIAPLKTKIGCFLWQLPPGFKKDEERLKNFCRQLKKLKGFKDSRHVFEFREKSWFEKNVYAILKDFQFCLCFADAPEKIGEEVLTCDYVYLRFHGSVLLYGSNYSDEQLRMWADKIKLMGRRIHTVYAFFNNDAHGHAVANAGSFRKCLLEVMSNGQETESTRPAPYGAGRGSPTKGD